MYKMTFLASDKRGVQETSSLHHHSGNFFFFDRVPLGALFFFLFKNVVIIGTKIILVSDVKYNDSIFIDITRY